MSVAPDGLPPVRRPSPSGVRKMPRKRPWYGEPDVLCILAILVALLAAFPHVEPQLADLIRAIRGVKTTGALEPSAAEDLVLALQGLPPAKVSGASETGDPQPKSGDGNPGPGVHADIVGAQGKSSTTQKATQ